MGLWAVDSTSGRMFTFCQMCAVMICLDAAGRLVGVGVESIQVRAYLLYWCEVLDHRCTSFEHSTLNTSGIPRGYLSLVIMVCSRHSDD